MTPTLTQAHLAKLQRGKAAAQRDRQRLEDAQVTAWRRWLTDDARLYAQLRGARAVHGDTAPETREAQAGWLANLRHEPMRPPDAAFKRARGEVDEPEA